MLRTSPESGNPLCLIPVATPSSQLAGNVVKMGSWKKNTEPVLDPSLLTLSLVFLTNWCHWLKKEHFLDCSNISVNVIFIHKEQATCKYRPLAIEESSANRGTGRGVGLEARGEHVAVQGAEVRQLPNKTPFSLSWLL